jgi:hypothetical protein
MALSSGQYATIDWGGDVTPEDEIRNVIARYCQCVNKLDADGFSPLFARDAQFHTRWGIRVGAQGARDHIDYLRETWPKNFRTRHTIGSSIIHVHGDTADALSDVIVFHSLDDKPWIVGQTGQYIDRFVIEDGRWCFAERRIDADTFVWPTN